MTAPRRQSRLRLGRRRPAGPPGKLRRRIGTGARLAAALFIVGGMYAVFSPTVQATADDEPAPAAAAAEGKQLYETYCINCHGVNAQGVPDRGPSLVGVGSGAV